MNIDMTQVHQVFFEESFEGLDVMESGLLHIGPGPVDAEQINAIFRAAHSIKGASGTFGFPAVAEFTHVIEALLGEMRDGRRPITATVIDILLRSVDVLREMLSSAQRGMRPDVLRVERQREELEKVSASDGALESTDSDSAGEQAVPDEKAPSLPHLAPLPESARASPLSMVAERRVEGDRRRIADRRAAAADSTGKRGSIRVDTKKIDALISLVGELHATQSRLELLGREFDGINGDQFRAGLAQLERDTRAVQRSVMQIRMVPISFVFSRLPRMIHDLSHRLDKKIDLQMIGQEIEVDKTMAEKIVDPLVQLVRNSLDHGIEAPAQRLAAGKPELGVIRLSAGHRDGDVVLTVRDDGRGLSADRILRKAVERGLMGKDEVLGDSDLFELICQPGFSTAEMVSDISGRGVGMDVVRRNINELGGTIDIDSTPNAGCTITIRLPISPRA